MRTISGIRRKSSALAVEVRFPDNTGTPTQAFAALASHLSPEGVFVSTFHPVHLGSGVFVEIALEGGPLYARGTVAHVRDPRVGPAGFAVAFDALSEVDRARIEAATDFRAIA